MTNIKSVGVRHTIDFAFVVALSFVVGGCASVDRDLTDRRNDSERLIAAIEDRDASEVSTLLSRGVDPDSLRARDRAPAVAVALSAGDLGVARLLLEAGADPDARTSSGQTVLTSSVYRLDAGAVALLLESGADPAVRDGDGHTVLHHSMFALNLARYRGEREVERSEAIAVRLAVSADAVNVADDAGRTPLTMYATFIAPRSEVVAEALLASGADPNVDVPWGGPVLLALINRGTPNVINALCESGAHLEVHDPHFGWTPLITATSLGRQTVARVLLDAGADPSGPASGPSRGDTPLHVAAVLKNSGEIFELLLDRGADIDVPDSLGNTALHIAASNGHRHHVEALLAAQANIDALNLRGQTPADLAAAKGHPDLAALIRG